LEVEISSMSFESVLLTTLDPARADNAHSSVAFKHSGFGEGKQIVPTKHINFFWRKVTGSKKKKKQDLSPIEGVYNSDGTINKDVVMMMEPKCILFERTDNLKSSITTKLAKSGEGAGLAKVRQAKRRKRKEKKLQTMQEQLEDERAAMRATGKLFLCDATCPSTQRFCRGIYLTKKGLERSMWPLKSTTFPRDRMQGISFFVKLVCLEASFKLGAVRIDSSMFCLKKSLQHRLEFVASRMHAVLVNLTEERMLWDIGSHLGFWRYLRSFTMGSQSCVPAK
jgi:hypothetical protein